MNDVINPAKLARQWIKRFERGFLLLAGLSLVAAVGSAAAQTTAAVPPAAAKDVAKNNFPSRDQNPAFRSG